MQFVPTQIAGVFVLEVERKEDARGFFARIFSREELQERGLVDEFPQHNVGYNHIKGTLRGMHFQRAPHAEAKLVICVQGAVYDVMADVRPGSPTFGLWDAFELTPENRRALFLPEGVAHGYQALSEHSTVHYHLSNYYAPHLADGIRWDDPTLAIRWPLPPAMLSEQDQRWGFLTR